MDMKSSSPKDIKQGALFLWLWREYLRRHMWVLAIIVVLMMIEGSMVGGLAWMMQPLFDGVFVGGSKSQLWLVDQAWEYHYSVSLEGSCHWCNCAV